VRTVSQLRCSQGDFALRKRRPVLATIVNVVIAATVAATTSAATVVAESILGAFRVCRVAVFLHAGGAVAMWCRC